MSQVRPWQWALARWAYGAAHWALLPLLLPLLALHPRLRGGLRQRLGFVGERGQGAVWLHGSSAGDVAALVPLAHRLRGMGHEVVLSAWTRAGVQMGIRRLGDGTRMFRAPLDLGLVVDRVVERIRPRALVLECLELWPTLVSACHRRGIPVVVVNGRLSARSLSAYGRAPWLFLPCFRSLALVTVLTDQDALRFIEAGVPARRVVVQTSSKHGSLSFLPPPAPRGGQRPRVVLGSLHRQEEDLLLPWVPRLLEADGALEVVVAPRYPHRAGEVVRALRRQGIEARTLSEAGDADAPGVMVVDRMGELADQYRGAVAAFVGGSLAPRGGHNVMEPAAMGTPVLFGPHTDNVRVETDLLLQSGAAFMVQSGQELWRRCLDLLQSREKQKSCGQAASRVATCLARAADDIARRIALLLGQGTGGSGAGARP